MSAITRPSGGIGKVFAAASVGTRQSAKNPNTAPFSIRLTNEERAYLDGQAGNQALGAYIRKVVLGQHVRKRRVIQKPQLTNVTAAKALAGLGQSRLAANVNQIAKSANIGVIDVSPALVEELQDACQHIREMRDELISALHVKLESEE